LIPTGRRYWVRPSSSEEEEEEEDEEGEDEDEDCLQARLLLFGASNSESLNVSRS